MTTDRRNVLVCVLIVLLSIAATVPTLEMGLNDDFSYTYMARELAATGHFHYVGWASAMVGIQAWFAALVIRIVGFSFTAVRFTTAAFAAGIAVLLYKLNRAGGLAPSFAWLGTLAVIVSPLFIPLAASFMTDVPALFFLLWCFYSSMQALEAPDRKASLFWLIVAAVSGFLGGTVRQVVWGVPLTTIPVIAWIRRDDKRVLSAGVFLFAALAAAVAISLFWLSRQAFFEWEPAPQGVDDLASVLQGLRRFAALIRTCLLLMLPVLIVYFFGWWRQRRWRIVIPGVLVFGTVWIIVQFGFRGAGFPFGNLVTQEGVLRQGTEAIGSKPVILSGPLLAVLSFMTLAAGTACVLALLHSSVGGRASSSSPQSTRRFVVLCAPFCAAYAAILLYRTMSGDVFDRYLLILLPVVNLPLLWLYQQRIRDRVPLAAWFTVGVFGVYGVATSHDYISSARARLAAASVVMADGVPRTSITAGMEFDGWTEIEASGHVNSFLISTWSSTPPSRPYRERPGGVWFRFWGLTPSVDPKYFVVYSRQPGLTDTAYPPVSYSVWLPPATRSVYTQTIKP